MNAIPLRNLWTAFVAVTVLGTIALGQSSSPTGDVYGTVVDEQDQPMRAATVALAGPGAVQSAETDAKGDFRFKSLSPGDYSLSIEKPGFETVHRQLTVSPGHIGVVTVTLPIASASESATVEGEGGALHSRSTTTGATFGRKELDSIPTTRDPWSILRQVPGVLVATMNVNGNSAGNQVAFVGKGTTADQNEYNLDGVTISLGGVTPAFFDFDSFDTIAVATGGSDPALSTPGVTLNLVTRRGTNLLRGSARGLYTSGVGWDDGIEAGGPILKDRLWLWGSYGRIDVPGLTFITNTGDPVRESPSLWQANVKLNAQAGPSTSLTGSLLDSDRTVDGRGAGPERSQPSTWNNSYSTQSLRADAAQVFSPQVFAQAYVTGLQFAYKNVPQGGDQQADLIDSVWRNSYYFRTVDGTQRQVGAIASAFFNTGDLRHELKFGFGYRHTSTDSQTTWPGDQLLGDNANGEATQANASVTRPSSIKYEINFYDTYVSDTVQLDRLTLSLGARFDYQQGRNLPAAVPANPEFPELLPAVAWGGNASYPITWRLVQPRIGAAYALGQNRNTLVRASYSRFANLLGNEVRSINPIPGVAQLYYYWNDLNGDQRVQRNEVELTNPPSGSSNVDPNHPGAAIPINSISKSFNPPTTDEFIVGVESTLSSQWTGSLAYTHRSIRNPEFSPLIGTSRSDYVFAGLATGIARAGGFALPFAEPYYALTLNPVPVGVELQNRPDYSETYDGVELQIIKPFSHGWMLRFGAAWNDWRQKVGAGAIVDPNNYVGGPNRSGPVGDATDYGTGATFTNARWQFNLSGLALLPLGIEAGANLFGRDGFPILYGVNVQGVGINSFYGTLQIGSVGTYRLAPVFQLDLHLERTFPIGSRIAVTALFDCFNAANSHTVLSREGNVGLFDQATHTLQPNDTFNEPGEVLSSRAVRGGVRITF